MDESMSHYYDCSFVWLFDWLIDCLIFVRGVSNLTSFMPLSVLVQHVTSRSSLPTASTWKSFSSDDTNAASCRSLTAADRAFSYCATNSSVQNPPYRSFARSWKMIKKIWRFYWRRSVKWTTKSSLPEGKVEKPKRNVNSHHSHRPRQGSSSRTFSRCPSRRLPVNAPRMSMWPCRSRVSSWTLLWLLVTTSFCLHIVIWLIFRILQSLIMAEHPIRK